MEHLSSLKVNQLKEQLQARGIDSKGVKATLVSRLHDSLEKAGEDPEAFAKGLESDGVEPGDSAKGVKATLVSRLHDSLEKAGENSEAFAKGLESDGVKPGDSASQVQSQASVGSGRSSLASSVRVRQLEEAATQASLTAKLKRLRERQEIERQVAELQRQKELLELEEALDVSRARETVMQDFSKLHVNPAAKSTNEPNPAPEPSPDNESKPKVNPSTETSETKQKSSPSSKLNPEHEYNQTESMPRCSSRDEREQTAALMRLPIVEIKKFGGEVTDFAHFMRSFDLKIGQKISDEAEKLYFLEQHMVPGSKPHHIVEGCLYLKDGYKEARRLLFKRYGQPNALASAYLDKILQQKPIKGDDSDGLDRYSILLTSCRNALQESTILMDDPRTMRSVTANLPQPLIHRWRRKVDDIEEGEGRHPTFEDVVTFVSKEARVSSNAVFGQQVYNRDQRRPAEQVKHHSAFKQKPFVGTTKAELPRSQCLYCKKENHQVTDCYRFGEAPWQDKRDFVMKGALCFSCLKKGHRSSECKRRATCKTCGKAHPTSLHFTRTDKEEYNNQPQFSQQQQMYQQQQQQQHQSQQGEQQSAVSSANVTSCRTVGEDHTVEKSVVLPVVPVLVHSPYGQEQTYAFLDSGSTHSFISSSLNQKLGLESVPHRNLSLTTVDRDVCVDTQVANGVWVTDLEGREALQLPQLFTLDRIPVTDSDFPSSSELHKWEHLRSVPLPELEVRDVGLLLGANSFLAMEPLEVIPSREGSPYAVRTRYGWILGGLRSGQGATAARVKVCRAAVKTDCELENMMTRLYNTEYEENLNSTKKGESVEDRDWLKKVERSIKTKDGHYEVGLPLAEDDLHLPSNRMMAERRLECLRAKLMKNKKLAEDYSSYMQDMIDRGYAELVPQNSLNRDDGKVWYLPHHAVVHPHKPDKIRIVFDCAAKCKGVCLNDCLLQGPDQTNSLMEVLLRFRMDNIAFIADVEGMFNQVRVPESDRDMLRFLWWKDGSPGSRVQEYRMAVHLFGASSSPSVACYSLRRTATDHENDFSAEAVSTVRRNFYVDDVLKSCATVTDAVELVRELRQLLEKGGFNLTKFASSSPSIVSSLPVQNRSKVMKLWSGPPEPSPDERALGVVWQTETDSLSVVLNVQNIRSKPLTRRGLLSAISSFYDPMGILAPTVFRGRLILQHICRQQLPWDIELPESQQREWLEWLSSVADAEPVTVSRSIKPAGFGEVVSYQLHHFADASQEGYGTVSFVRLKNNRGDIHCAFLKGKSHLAPLKVVTIPRLELMAAVTAVRVSSLIRDAIQLEIPDSVHVEEHFWTDSTTVLRYVENKKSRFHTFVSNRLAVIHDGSTPQQWKYVPSELNPADDVTRGVQGVRWLEGPAFLWQEEDMWPQRPEALRTRTARDDEDDPEIRRAKVNVIKTESTQEPIEVLVNYYSEKGRLLRGIAWILKVKKALQNRTTNKKEGPSLRLTVSDLQEAEQTVVRWTQRRAFEAEYEALMKGSEVKLSSKLIKLSPFLQGGVIRVGGRLINADASPDVVHHVVLPSHSRFTDLVVRDAHARVGHGGRQAVLAEIRKKFWVLKASSTVRRVLRSCLKCRRLHGPTLTQKMASLPQDRVQAMEPPFTRTGLDYFGPFYIRQGRAQAKRYGVLFTCLSVRAVHIELAADLTSDSFICALRRFVARRGNVKVLRSDCGTNFVGANNELKKELAELQADDKMVHETLLAKGIDWKFNTPSASHHGGVWERQIRSVRRILESMLKGEVLREETLHTLMCEVESILNSRPLTPFSPDLRDSEPLTPNHILLLDAGHVTMPVSLFRNLDQTQKRWKQAQYLANMFWRRWRTEYLPVLQERCRVMTRSQSNVLPDDIVLLVDGGVPRGQWPLGRVTRVKRGADGLVRSVDVLSRGVIVQRPITKLVKLSGL